MDESNCNLRSLNEVKSMMKVAKLDPRNHTQLVQALYYPKTEDLSNDNLLLLELDDHLLERIKVGDTLEFKGALSEPVVLCSNEKTYEVKIAEISNSLLVLPELQFAEATSNSPLRSPRTGNKSLDNSLNDSLEDNDEAMAEIQLEHKPILKIFHEYLECREINPRFNKMKELLHHTLYTGPENEEYIDRKLLFTRSQLLETVQCSRRQFELGVRQCRAVQIDGYMRVLCHMYEYRILSVMLGLIRENSWELNEIEREETLQALEGIAPPVVVSELFNLYTFATEGKPNKFTYDEELVARIVVQNILQPGLMFRYDEFFSTWQEALPEGMSPNEKYLRYLGVVDFDGSMPSVRSLSEDTLPTNLQERMGILFKTKTKWTMEEIEPYIECFSTPSISVSTLLAKHARSLTENNVRYYVSKY